MTNMGHTHTPSQLFILVLYLSSNFNFATVSGCQVDGISNWWLDLSVVDTDRGVFFQGATTDIQGILTAEHSGEGLNSGPYFVATHENSQFVLALHENFALYEEYETSQSMSISVTFSCANGNTQNIVFIISVIDTNNNDPIFIPTNELEFVVTPPLPPGYLLTGCLSNVNVRDIDLTTQRIEFNIEPNEYFEIAYDAASSTEAKNFGAVLQTTTFIRSLSEPVTLWISATDVDLTGDPPRTTYATLRIEADGDFQFPEELVFSQVFYLGTYTTEDELSFDQPIFLAQGYDDSVNFTLTGANSELFALVRQGNQVTIQVPSPLTTDILMLGQILLELRSEREYTSGATATIVINLPQGLGLEFTQAHYEGRIIDNSLDISVITLAQGYENGYNVSIINEHSTYFSITTQNNAITLSMSPLETNIIEANNLLTLQLVATSDSSSSSTVVVLEIIKNDTITPVFEESLYAGSYQTDTGLSLGDIVLVQGYDETVLFYIDGEYEGYFNIIQSGNIVNLQVSSSLPQDVIEREDHILLTVGATKPRTVGATTTISINLPSARELSFETSSYTGQVERDDLTLETILLSTGYAEDVSFTLIGEYAALFSITNIGNAVTINLATSLSDEIIFNNNIIILTLEGSGVNTLTAVTNIVLEVIKEDILTPIFTSALYYGTYSEAGILDVEDISLSQGFDDSVTFTLQGANSEYFSVSNLGNNVLVSKQSDIPAEVIYNSKVFVFNILADKPLTVGANAAVSITFESELTETTVLRFSESNYVGYLTNNTLTLGIITLENEFTNDTQISLNGEHSSYFSWSNTENIITISMNGLLPDDVLQNTKFIILEIGAQRERAVPAYASIIIDVISDAITPPVFSAAFYQGAYTNENGLQFDHTVYLQQGFDDTVTYELEGEFSEWFTLTQNNEGANLNVPATIPEEIVESYRQFLFTIVANKPGTVGARAAISIDLPDEASTALLRFARASYVGRIENTSLQLEPIILLGEYNDNLNFTISGEYSNFFTLNPEGNMVTIELSQDFLVDSIIEVPFIVLEIEVSRPESISGSTTVVLEIVREAQSVPVFERTFYTGSYSIEEGLNFDNTIQLILGYDDSVQFMLEGDDAEWFGISQAGNNVTLSVTNENLSQVRDRTHLVFSVLAYKPGVVSGNTAVVISLTDQSANILRFSQVYYRGSLEQGLLVSDEINLEEGYPSDVQITISGDLEDYFEVTNANNSFILRLTTELPTEVTEYYNFTILTLEARSTEDVAFATVIIQFIKDAYGEMRALVFEQAFYSGSYSDINGLYFDQEIRLLDIPDSDVEYLLEGELSEWFSLQQSGHSLTLSLINNIPQDLLDINPHLAFSIKATSPNYIDGNTVIILSVTKDVLLQFERINYIGSVNGNISTLESIVLSSGFSENVIFTLRGDLMIYFKISSEGPSVAIELETSIPETLVPENRIILLELEATAPQAYAAYATIVFAVDAYNENGTISYLRFSEVYYTGVYSENNELYFDGTIALEDGYDETVAFVLEGDNSDWFSIVQNANSVELVTTPEFPTLNLPDHVMLTIVANKPGVTSVAAGIFIIIHNDNSNADVAFDRVLYTGTFESGFVQHEVITVTGYNGTEIGVFGVYSNFFEATTTEGVVVVQAVETATLPEEVLHVALELRAGTAAAALVLEIPQTDETSGSEVSFDRALYTGTFESGVVQHDPITISGYNGTEIEIIGVHSESFEASVTDGAVFVQAAVWTAFPVEVQHVVLELRAGSAAAVLVVDIYHLDETSESEVSFDRALYTGTFESGVVQHDPITISGYNGTEIGILGDYSEFFEASVTDGTVLVQATASATFPTDILHVALELRAGIAATALVLDIRHSDETSGSDVSFDRALYTGTFEGGVVQHDPISISGYNGTEIGILGDHSEFFEATVTDGTVLVQATASSTFPTNILHVALELRADIAATALVLDIRHSDDTSESEVSFDRALYTGTFEGGVVQHDPITISGYSGTEIGILGVYSVFFEASVTDGTVVVQATAFGTFPANILHVALELRAGIAATALVLDIQHSDETSGSEVSFDRALYTGTFEGGVVEHDPITISGYNATEIGILGDYSESFEASVADGIVLVQATVTATFPADILHVALELRAGIAATALVLDIRHSDETSGSEVSFDRALYTGTFEGGVVQHDPITISGYNGTEIGILGDYSEFFEASVADRTVIVQATAMATFPADILHVALELRAGIAATALVLDIQHSDEAFESEVSFDRALYTGTFESGVVQHDPITISGYNGTEIQLLGVYSELFSASVTGDAVIVQAAVWAAFPVEIQHVALELRVESVAAVLVLDIQHSEEISTPEQAFSRALYTGTLESNVVQHETITLTGYDGTEIGILGTYAEFFEASATERIVTVQTLGGADFPSDVLHVALELRAGTAATALVLDILPSDETSGTEVVFDKALYTGTFEAGVVQHEPITASGYSSTDVAIFGVYSDLFEATATEGAVVVQASGSSTLPAEVLHVALELRAGSAATALVLDVYHTDEPGLPIVEFSAASYEIRTDVAQIGIIGRVTATADNGERLVYSLLLDNVHLQERLSINEDGELQLFAPANSGVYSFSVAATTIISQVSASATVRLTVDAVTVCGADDLVVPPLIVLDRDEEEPHADLIVIDGEQFLGCQYSLTNRWPLDQNWLYVDERGLHALSIDREDESIAFMALSQVQVELILHCDSDDSATTRLKRSLSDARLDWLGPYDYGNNKWIISETILYNSRRTVVNLIVNDINDNAPMFIGKENEPIAVGYPVDELVEVLSPKSLIDLKATDADVGENAALLYWSSAAELAVSPTTGLVHVRDNVRDLQDGSILTVHATDQNGQGLTGDIDILVRILDIYHIAVVTIRDAFLEDEENILANLTSAVGYDVKALSATVISDQYEDDLTYLRHKRQVIETRGASLQLYIYGLFDYTPVEVNQLTSDINNNLIASVIVADSLSLQDYLESRETCVISESERDMGLLVATIVLSILLFIIAVCIATWFFLKWKKERKYNQFSDENSLASQNDSIEAALKPEPTRPRLNIDELKRSERRLQEMLDAPVDNVIVEPITTSFNRPKDTIDVAPIDINAPIVIQSIDKLKEGSEDEDEFGERKNNARRKSVVTFNENVEKIIHVEDLDTADSFSDCEIERL